MNWILDKGYCYVALLDFSLLKAGYLMLWYIVNKLEYYYNALWEILLNIVV